MLWPGAEGWYKLDLEINEDLLEKWEPEARIDKENFLFFLISKIRFFNNPKSALVHVITQIFI